MKHRKSDNSDASSDHEMVDLADDPSFIEGQVDEAMKSVKSSQRGRKPLPIRWSRLIDLQNPEAQTAEGFDIEEDCAEAIENAPYPPRQTKKRWQALFHPKTYWNALGFKDLEDNKLNARKLEEYAIKASQMRKLFKDRACRSFLSSSNALQMGLANAAELSKKIQNRGSRSTANPNEIKPSEYKEPISIACRKKGKHRAKVTLREKILMIHRVINQYHSEKEVAKEFRVS